MTAPSQNDVIEALRALLQHPPERDGTRGLSTREIQRALGIGDRLCKRLLRELADAGRLGSSRRASAGIDGVRRYTPIYYLRSSKRDSR